MTLTALTLVAFLMLSLFIIAIPAAFFSHGVALICLGIGAVLGLIAIVLMAVQKFGG